MGILMRNFHSYQNYHNYLLWSAYHGVSASSAFFSPWWCSPRPSLHTPPSPFSLLLTNGAQYASFEYSTSSPKSAEFDAFFPESEPIFSPLVTINARVITTPPHLTDEVVFWVMNIFCFFFSLFLKADFYLQVHWTFFQNSAGLFWVFLRTANWFVFFSLFGCCGDPLKLRLWSLEICTLTSRRTFLT